MFQAIVPNAFYIAKQYICLQIELDEFAVYKIYNMKECMFDQSTVVMLSNI